MTASVSPRLLRIVNGSSGTTTLTVTVAAKNTFTVTPALQTCAGGNITATFTPATQTIDGSEGAAQGTFTANISVSAGTVKGIYNCTINATDSSGNNTALTNVTIDTRGIRRRRARRWMEINVTSLAVGLEGKPPCAGEPVQIYVKRKNKDIPIKGADVDVYFEGKKIFYNIKTDREGKCQFTPEKPGEYTIEVEKGGYHKEEITITLDWCVPPTTTTVAPTTTTRPTTTTTRPTTTTTRPRPTTTTVRPTTTTTRPTTTTIAPTTTRPRPPTTTLPPKKKGISTTVILVVVVVIIVVAYLVTKKKGGGTSSTPEE